VVVASLLGYFVVAAPVQGAVLRAQVAWEAPIARDAALPAANGAHAAWLKGVSATLGLRHGPVYSATYDVCFVDHDDGGWFALSYSQKCQLSYVDFYALSKRNGAVETAIEEARAEKYGTHSSGMVFVQGYLTGADLPFEDLPDGTPDTLWATMPGTRDARAATDVWMVTFSRIVGYAEDEAFAGRKLLGETGRTALDPHKQYVVVPDAREYYTKVLGCAIGRPLFCTSPLGG
jgi:hypothetical protein